MRDQHPSASLGEANREREKERNTAEQEIRVFPVEEEREGDADWREKNDGCGSRPGPSEHGGVGDLVLSKPTSTANKGDIETSRKELPA
jgi:hypothetical protein